MIVRLCRCGHGYKAHEHYTRFSDCALCDCLRWHWRRLPWGKSDG